MGGMVGVQDLLPALHLDYVHKFRESGLEGEG